MEDRTREQKSATAAAPQERRRRQRQQPAPSAVMCSRPPTPSAVSILTMLLDAGRALFAAGGDSAAATMLQVAIQHSRLPLLRAVVEHPSAWRCVPDGGDHHMPCSAWPRVEAAVVALYSAFHASDAPALDALAAWLRRLHDDRRRVLEEGRSAKEEELPQAVRSAAHAAARQRGGNSALVAALAAAQGEAASLAEWRALEAKFDSVIRMALGAVLACAPSIATGGLVRLLHT